MAKVDSKGTNWDTYSGTDGKMDITEANKFWDNVVKKNEAFTKIDSKEQDALDALRNKALGAGSGSDFYIDETEFNNWVKEINNAMDYKEKQNVTFTNPLTDFKVLDTIYGGTSDGIIKAKDIIQEYINEYALKYAIPLENVKEVQKLLDNMFTKKSGTTEGAVNFGEFDALFGLLERAKTEDITNGNIYSFDLNKPWRDLQLLDIMKNNENDATEKPNDDQSINSERLGENYIDKFKAKYSTQITEEEIKYIKKLSSTFITEGKDTSVDKFRIISQLLNQSKEDGITIGGNKDLDRAFDPNGYPGISLGQDPNNLTYDAILAEAKRLNKRSAAQNKGLTKNEAEALLHAYYNKDKNVSKHEMQVILNLLDDMYQNTGEHGTKNISVFMELLSLMESAKSGEGHLVKNRYTFNFDEKSNDYKEDFEAVDRYSTIDVNSLNGQASKIAILDYVNTFVTQNNLNDPDKKQLIDFVDTLMGSQSYFSEDMFNNLRQVMKSKLPS